MSIETLLEAAKFLELQAQQQQKARGKFGLCLIIVFYMFIPKLRSQTARSNMQQEATIFLWMFLVSWRHSRSD